MAANAITAMKKPRRAMRAFAWLCALYVIACIVAGIALAEMSLHLHKLPLGDTSVYRAHIQQHLHTAVEDASITAADRARLDAWFIQPPHPNGKSVIILHGVTANRIGSSGFAEIFLDQGYSVLMPDSRDTAHLAARSLRTVYSKAMMYAAGQSG
jgi:hypothetical protein